MHKLLKLSYSTSLLQWDIKNVGNSQAVQWLGLHASTLGGIGSIPGQGTKIPQAMQCGQK